MVEPPSRGRLRWTTGALGLTATLAVATAVSKPVAAQEPQLPGAIFELYVNLTLIDGRGGEPEPSAAILVTGGRIQAAGPRDALVVPEGARIVDLEGAFVVPGFLDASASPRDSATLAAMLASGITGVREAQMPLDRFARFRRDVPVDDPHPDVFIGGPVLEGPGGETGTRIAGPGEIEEIVGRTVERDGAGFVSVGASVPGEWIPDLVRAARDRRVPVWIERRTEGWRLAIRSSPDAVAGLISLDPALVPAARREGYRATLAASPERAAAEWLAAVDPDGPEMDAVVTSLLSRDAAVVPLLAAAESRGLDARGLPAALDLVRLLDGYGIRMAVGSGTPSSEASAARFHRELELLVQAGIPPVRALAMASRDGAIAVGELHRRGTIEQGKRADFVVLEADPVADIVNSRRVRYVILEGRAWAPRPEGGLERVRFR